MNDGAKISKYSISCISKPRIFHSQNLQAPPLIFYHSKSWNILSLASTFNNISNISLIVHQSNAFKSYSLSKDKRKLTSSLTFTLLHLAEVSSISFSNSNKDLSVLGMPKIYFNSSSSLRISL